MSAKPLVSKPWGFKNPEKFTADVLTLLDKFWTIRTVGALNGCHLVQHQPGQFGPVWSLNDNGGEINLAPINSHDPDQNVSVTAWSQPLDAGTIAYRIAMTVTGQDVDWNFTYPDAMDDLRCVEAAAKPGT